jgi:ATP-dependent DNA helicase RecG
MKAFHATFHYRIIPFLFYGKMKPADKDAEMKRFSDGKTNVWSLQQLLKLG